MAQEKPKVSIEIPALDRQMDYVLKKECMETIQKLSDLSKTDGSWMMKPCYKRFNEGYESPSKDELNDAFDGYTSRQIAHIVGTDDRNVRRWKAGEVKISYPAWRLFLVKTGKVIA